MDKDLKFAIDLVTVLIAHNGGYPSKADIEEAIRRIVASGFVPGIDSRAGELVQAVSARYPDSQQRFGQPLVLR